MELLENSEVGRCQASQRRPSKVWYMLYCYGKRLIILLRRWLFLQQLRGDGDCVLVDENVGEEEGRMET